MVNSQDGSTLVVLHHGSTMAMDVTAGENSMGVLILNLGIIVISPE